MTRKSKPQPSEPMVVSKEAKPQTSEVEVLKPAERITNLVAQQTSYQGPIPPPALFKQYGEVVTDAPERILRQFELDSAHFREISKQALQGEIDHNGRAQWMAFALVIVGIASAIWCAHSGFMLLSCAIIGTLLVAVLINFLRPNQVQAQDQTEKPEPQKKKAVRK